MLGKLKIGFLIKNVLNRMTSFPRHCLIQLSIYKKQLSWNRTCTLKKPKLVRSLKLMCILRSDFTNHEEDNDHIKIMKHNISTTTSTIVKHISFFGFLNLTLMQDVCLLTIIMLAQHPCTLKWWDYDTIGVPVTYCSNKIKITKRIVSLGYTIKS